ncbi:vWA domain-containing protein [Nocardiopsis ganjiahuensis]|uniref:vWA domain-containing protein n=1 Tax=Nocardiopsis ganjiahuensis TaxID=239984 RepID=UPI00034D4871|nr:VWA domain-containing protein [Nocardiopsis ganjiahuensis]
MRLSAQLEFDVLALNAPDSVLVLLEATAPELTEEGDRPPATFQVVLDRSGSMNRDRRIHGVVEALHGLVDRLDPADHFGLVSFNNQARVEAPAGPLTDKDQLRRRLSGIRAHGGTDLSSGLLRGIQEARRAGEGRGATLLLVSDGHANQGTTDHDLLRDVARGAYEHGITVTTLGYGLGYDEELLGAIAQGGAGSALFAEDADTAGGMIADEAEYLLAKTAQAASLTVRGGAHVERLSVVGETFSTRLEDGALMVELGDFFSGESRRLLLRVSTAVLAEADARSGGGPVPLAEVELVHVDPGTLETRTTRLELTVETAWEVTDRVGRPEVRAEDLFQRAQTAKRLAAYEMRRGHRAEASRHLRNSRDEMSAALGTEEFGAVRSEMGSQIEALGQMAAQAEQDDVQRAAKTIHASRSGALRGRGPQGRPGGRLRGGRDRSDQSFPDSPAPEER